MFGKKLRKLREEKGWSQMKLATETYFSVYTIHRWESGRVEPSLGNAKRVANILGVSLDDLV